MSLGGGVRGKVAVVKWSYYAAAALRDYTVTYSRQSKEWRLAAMLVEADAFKMAQRPLTLVAQVIATNLVCTCGKRKYQDLEQRPVIQPCPKCGKREWTKSVVEGAWRWPIESVTIERERGIVTAQLGPPLP